MPVLTGHGGFYLGLGSHDWGRPVVNLSDDRFLAAPEIAARFYSGMTAHARQHSLGLGSILADVRCLGGPPLQPGHSVDSLGHKGVQR
jgi:hypothetical protein